MTELCTNDLPSAPFAASPDDSIRWLVCHTKPRCEKKFAALLTSIGFTNYLPLVENVRRYSDGTVHRSTLPLFPSYVFAQIPIASQRRIYEQQLIVRTLSVDNERVFLGQLEQVKKVVSAGIDAILRPRVIKGVRVRIKSGALWGVEGKVADPTNPEGVVLEVDVLQQGLLVKIPMDQLEILN